MRATVRISEVARSRMQLRPEGGELRAVGNHSLSINDKKQLWADFGTDEGGDIFKFLQTYAGLSFIEAVKEVARLAGEEVPWSNGNGTSEARKPARGDQPRLNGHATQPDFRDGRAVPVSTWEYTDEAGRPVYQTVRLQWRQPDGSWEKDKAGKIRKAFYQ